MEITFFTSSLPKLAHSRHLLTRYGLIVQGFREQTYHANYREPRILDRELLLRQSYESALEQAKRAGILTSNRFFFLEDTSVEIPALSVEGREVPGLDIKYWMRENTFETVDALLKANGNDRRAIVRSHVVLHIPSRIREIREDNYEFRIFSSEQHGHISRREEKFTTNLMYPWLDNRTFNKWFCPADAKFPIGKMDISEADKFDFRRPAFENMAKFISEAVPKTTRPRQLSLTLEENGNLVICGYPCAGKTTAGQQLARELGYLHIEASDFMHLAYNQRHGLTDEFSISEFALCALKEQPDVAASEIIEFLHKNPIRPWVITGFRALAEIDALHACLKNVGQEFKTVFIESDMETRYLRMTTRNRSGDTSEMGEFARRDEQQKEMGLDIIRSTFEHASIANMGSLADFLALVLEAAYGAGCKVSKSTESMQGFKTLDLDEVPLQDAILISLLTKWSDSENREYFTTTEIAHLTGKVFPNATKKQKDNVSRYFNQSFYPYYESIVGTDRMPNRYRLSNTGYGEAINRLRALNLK